MMWLLFLPAFSFLLLSAHFLRDGQWLVMILPLLATVLLAVPRAWSAHLVRLALVAGALVWLHSLVAVATMRWTMELPFLRLSVILSVVILMTVSSIFVFEHPRLKRHYGHGSWWSD